VNFIDFGLASIFYVIGSDYSLIKSYDLPKKNCIFFKPQENAQIESCASSQAESSTKLPIWKKTGLGQTLKVCFQALFFLTGNNYCGSFFMKVVTVGTFEFAECKPAIDFKGCKFYILNIFYCFI
jgi:hypothetical protein